MIVQTTQSLCVLSFSALLLNSDPPALEMPMANEYAVVSSHTSSANRDWWEWNHRRIRPHPIPSITLSSVSTWNRADFEDSSNDWKDRRMMSDRVVRVLDDDTVVKLEKSGLVKLAGVQIPKTYDTECPYSSTANTKMK